MSTIGTRIKWVRKQNEYNQVDFAGKIGVSQGTLSELEQDKYNPSIETVMAIREKFNTDINWLLYGILSSANEVSHLELRLDVDEIKLIEKLRKLNIESREDIISFIEIKFKRNNKS